MPAEAEVSAGIVFLTPLGRQKSPYTVLWKWLDLSDARWCICLIAGHLTTPCSKLLFIQFRPAGQRPFSRFLLKKEVVLCVLINAE